jgi:peptide chain release factor subunit 1
MEQNVLRTTLKALSSCRGAGTTLVSLMIPCSAQVSQTRQHIVNEIGEAGNIKCRQTRQDVLRALGSAKVLLEKAKTTSTTGLAVYTGYVTSRGGATEFV